MRALAVALALVAGGVQAAEPPLSVRDCDSRDVIADLAEPWEKFTDTLADGAVRVAVIDRGEPAAAAMQLLVLSPPVDETGGRRCKVVALDAAGTGFGSIDFAERGAAYDPARGLLLDMPVQVHDPDTGGQVTRQLSVTIRQDTGAVAARLLR